jgi:hypothetical protein
LVWQYVLQRLSALAWTELIFEEPREDQHLHRDHFCLRKARRPLVLVL